MGALSWGTRIADVFYPIVEANDERVNDEHVQELLRDGLDECVIWKEVLPHWARRWLAQVHNSCHCGTSLTLEECIDDALLLHSDWRVEAEIKGICSRSDAGDEGYAKKEWNFVKDREEAKQFLDTLGLQEGVPARQQVEIP